ncbi:hypothetical protein Ocin01_17062 [Orchesella cincta]|uniref:Uncharacterized protein n=1 Tax=Orchesella cincta TaxID=48709 RepID=A0A1D2M9H1_ORCCI|nr:hypothetical protein Ocin01_17062 [Orchesella cincta]
MECQIRLATFLIARCHSNKNEDRQQ